MILEGLPVLTGALLIGILSGQVLARFQDRLLAIPILLALVPAVNGVGGNVGSVLGARVASGMHMGGLWSNKARGFRRDLAAAILLAGAAFAFLAVLAWGLGPLLGVRVPVSLGSLLATTLFAGAMLAGTMILLVILVGMLSHRYGWDPDNVVVPVLTTAVDALGIVFLLLSAQVMHL
jgi:mgtE-like transporter